MIELLTLLVAGHFLADFGLQSDFVARNKYYALSTAMGFFSMTAHAMIHGLVTAAIVTWLGYDWVAAFWAVTLAHWAIDLGKCRKWYGIVVDQALHVVVLTVMSIIVIGV